MTTQTHDMRRDNRRVRARDISSAVSSPSLGTPGEGWGGGCVGRVSVARSPTLTLPRSTGGGDKSRRIALAGALGVLIILLVSSSSQAQSVPTLSDNAPL